MTGIEEKLSLDKQEYLLDRSGVDEISAKMEEWLKKIGVSRHNIIRLRLTMEELLLRVCERYGGSKKVELIIGKRVTTPMLFIRYEGESYDPTMTEPAEENLKEDGRKVSGEADTESGENAAGGRTASVSSQDDSVFDSQDAWTKMILSRLGMTPEWTYRNGVNEICLRATGRTVRSETKLAIAAVLAVLCGLAGGLFPAVFTGTAVEFVLQPVSGLFINALNTFIGMMIFLTVVTAISSVGTISDFSKMGKSVVGNMMRNNVLTTGICMALMRPFFHFGTGTVQGGGSPVKDILNIILSIIPSDPVSPFQRGDMRQIVFMAVLTGCALLVLETKTASIRNLLEQLNTLVCQVIQGICRLLPVYIFASLVSMLWLNGAGIFVWLWKPLVIYLLMAALMLIAKTALVSLKLHIKPQVLLSREKKSMLIGLTTASSSAALGAILDINENKLGISEKMSRFSSSIGCLFVTSTHGVIFAVILYYLAEHYGMAVDLTWFVTMWIMCVLFSMAIPPVSGGMLVVTGMLMTQLNIPHDGLAVAGLLSMVLDFVGTMIRIGVMHQEILLRAAHLNMWDRSVLKDS